MGGHVLEGHVVRLDLDRVGELVRAVEDDRVAIDAADRDPGLVLGHDDAARVEPGADEDHVAGLRRRDRCLDRRVVVGHADQPALALRRDRQAAASSSVPDHERDDDGEERTSETSSPLRGSRPIRSGPRALGRRQRAAGLGEVHAIVPAEHPEHEVVALRPALPVQPDALPVRVARAAPQLDVRRPERLELGEQLERVVIVGVQPVHPQILVVADELRPVVREDPPVAAGHHDLGVRDVGQAQEHRPLARLRAGRAGGRRPRR